MALLAVFGGYVGLLGSHVGTMFFPFCLYLTASEGYAGTFGTFGGYVGTMLGRQGAVLVSFERYVGPFGAYVGPLGSHVGPISRRLGRCWCFYVGPFEGYIGLLLGPFLGLCWALLADFGPKI